MPSAKSCRFLLGQVTQPVAYRANLDRIPNSPVVAYYWNISKR